jgi:hypothetical protein
VLRAAPEGAGEVRARAHAAAGPGEEITPGDRRQPVARRELTDAWRVETSGALDGAGVRRPVRCVFPAGWACAPRLESRTMPTSDITAETPIHLRIPPPPSPHSSRPRLANNAGFPEALVSGGPGPIRPPSRISTPQPSRGAPDRYPVRLSPGLIPPRK